MVPEAELRELIGEGSAPAGLLLAHAAEPRPSVLFSLSHGLGPPRDGWDSAALQRELQGALVLPGGQLLTGAELTSRPFIAALPQAVLANPEGPLAVMGHVDLAWAYSYLDQGRDTSSNFFGILHAPAEGRRAGVALSTLLRFLNETSIDLTTLYNHEAKEFQAGRPSSVDPVARAWLWMLRQDLAGYILLGDPAVRLPLTPAR